MIYFKSLACFLQTLDFTKKNVFILVRPITFEAAWYTTTKIVGSKRFGDKLLSLNLDKHR